MRNYIYVFITVFLLAGCAGEQRAIKYYTIDSYAIEPPETADIHFDEPLPYIVEVADFTIAGPYNDSRIALRTDSNELEYYHYHQWAETPGHAVRYFIWRILHDAGIFEVCQLRLTVRTPQYVVTGAINRIERVDVEGEAGAYIDGAVDLVDVRENRILVSHRFDTLAPFAANASMNVFAREVNNILQNETHVFIEKIHDYFTSE